MDISGKKIMIFGLARSGAGAANLLAGLGAEVTVTDKKSDKELTEYVGQLSPSVKLSLSGHPMNLNGTDLIVVSPGVPLSIEPLRKAREQGVKIIGELELAYQVIVSQRSDLSPQPEFLAVTGTNGKSTTTALLDYILKRSGLRTMLGGNIGKALTEEICKNSTSRISLSGLDYIVAEVSSFQLETVEEFKAKGAAILNITPDHMDRYSSLEEYTEAKAHIFLNQDENDFLVLNADDPETMKLYNSRLNVQNSKAPVVYFFSRQKKVKGVYWREGQIYCNFPHLSFTSYPLSLISSDEVKIKGVHNLENAMASSAMALLTGCNPEAVRVSLREFPGLEHRMELVREIEGVKYINDSKGTNVDAVVKSLEGFKEPIILIAGGRDKSGDFTRLAPLVKEKVKALVLIGEAAEKIQTALAGYTRTILASDLKAAMEIAKEMAQRGDIVLLSPACASFDMFRDFEDRGRHFKDLVGEMP